MANIVYKMLIAQTRTDFRDQENRTCTGKLPLHLFQTSKNNKKYYNNNQWRSVVCRVLDQQRLF